MRKYGIPLLLLALLALAGCAKTYSSADASHGAPLAYVGDETQMLCDMYQAMLQTFPGREITALAAPEKGFSTWSRVLWSNRSEKATLVPVRAVSPSGGEVDAYVIRVSGRTGIDCKARDNNRQLFRNLKMLFDRKYAKAVPR